MERCRISSRASSRNLPVNDPIPTTANHLLELLQTRLTKYKSSGPPPNDKYTFRNVNKLIEAGIHFKTSQRRSLAHIKFSKHWFSANVELPPITVDDSTKPMLLNLIAYEKCSHDASAAWVTSYICFLDSLIDDPEDVKVLREAGVIENSLGSDKEVVKLFNEIATDLVPNSFAYSEARSMIQQYYESWSMSLLTQLKHEYVRTPWAFLIILALTAVQVYFTIWSPKSRCDDLCTFLKMNHHL
ncbi:hypothetical protein L1987_32286 [Smallanthus sonchifolius]|uniref:Uncharacterized protein n=1 Tax=Smallanthus sonchifolius TaxID=185202 RepID=A0ACB9I9F3_9ASTR|nr:hypothetical protein L1987_32286 [Smallanthus sonchifolius]